MTTAADLFELAFREAQKGIDQSWAGLVTGWNVVQALISVIDFSGESRNFAKAVLIKMERRCALLSKPVLSHGLFRFVGGRKISSSVRASLALCLTAQCAPGSAPVLSMLNAENGSPAVSINRWQRPFISVARACE